MAPHDSSADVPIDSARGSRFFHHWRLVIGASVVISLLATAAFYVNEIDNQKETVTWSYAFVVQAVHWMLWAFCYPLFFVLMRRFPLDRRDRWKSLSVYVLATPVIIFLHATVYLATLVYVLPSHFEMMKQHLKMDPFGSWRGFFWALCMLDFAYRVLGFSFLLSFSYALDYYERYRHKALETAQLETQLAHARLEALKMQLQPHFLFNTLNAISALLHRDPDAADRMIARLGDFLRMTLENDGGHEVPLAQEMAFLNCYLAIEQVRFADRLTTRVDMPAETESALVPNLILQPLVENAIRHGIGQVTGAGCIEIAAARRDGCLRLQVADNGAGWTDHPDDTPRGGVGIANTRRRLAQLYGADHRIEILSARGQGCRVCLEIPFRIAGADTARPESG